jgi:hypothetical protein
MKHTVRVWKVRVRPKMSNYFNMDMYLFYRIMLLNKSYDYSQSKCLDALKIEALIKITKPSLEIKPGACIIKLITAVIYRFP